MLTGEQLQSQTVILALGPERSNKFQTTCREALPRQAGTLDDKTADLSRRAARVVGGLPTSDGAELLKDFLYFLAKVTRTKSQSICHIIQ